MILLTKSTDVNNLLNIEHNRHTILSWSLNPPEISERFEANVPSPQKRIAAMQKCADAGYPLRAVIMPIIPTGDWQNIYNCFLENLLKSVPLNRITLGQICSYSSALQLTEEKLGKNNHISKMLDKVKSKDGRIRFPSNARIEVYKYLIDKVRQLKPQLQIGLCMEEVEVFKALEMENAIRVCNCIL
jgi:spore photoproduct lyase